MAQRVGQLLPGQAGQHPGVGAQGIAVEACGAGCLEPLEVAGFGFFYTAGQIQRPAAGAVREFQQGPAVVDQLQAVSQAGEGGVFQPGGLGRRCRRGSETAGCGCPAAAGGGHWLLAGSRQLPEAVVGREKGYAGSAWFPSNHLDKRVG
jgi:hypothetical protein